MSFQTPLTIKHALENIIGNRYLLPAIQREFVWKHRKIEWLFDSLMQNYPIGSFLFWEVSNDSAGKYKFYKFISEFREKYKTHNEEISTDGIPSFNAILDGQQRLTALYIGLKGSFAYRTPRIWEENTERVYPTRRLYLNIRSWLEKQEDGRVYEFVFLKDTDTNKNDMVSFNEQQWFRVGKILELENISKFNKYLRENDLSEFSMDILGRLQQVIHSDSIINYFWEREQNYDKALNIFIRMNSGGEPLTLSDLVLSIAVANWKKKDARKSINDLVDNIRDKGFSISKDLILKMFLFLYSKDIRFKVTNFSKGSAEKVETRWEMIRDSILSTFDLIRSFRFIDSTLTSKNAILPIVYYLYHKDLYKEFTTKIQFKEEREIIKKWLHIVLVKQLFGGQANSILIQIRSIFTEDIEEYKMKRKIEKFPINEIQKAIKKKFIFSDESIKELLCSQKEKYTFSILCLLYPTLDYRNNNFHIDHIHPANRFKKLPQELKEKYKWDTYNSIYNLQMLDANENMSKKDMNLKDWVERETKDRDKIEFLESHLIPNINLELTNFEEYIKRREEILIKQLKRILN